MDDASVVWRDTDVCADTLYEVGQTTWGPEVADNNLPGPPSLPLMATSRTQGMYALDETIVIIISLIMFLLT